MLVLTRKRNQTIVFPGLDISIKVIRTGNTVKLGVDAPQEHLILRGEKVPLQPTPPEDSGVEATNNDAASM